MKAIILSGFLCLYSFSFLYAQEELILIEQKQEQDSLYIYEVEESKEPVKILHAEPLYIDLIRDLGARKGEKEWNIGLGIHDKLNYDSYEALVEYEWAPLNRLGLEVEVPLTIYTPNSKDKNGQLPSNRIESIKTAAQYTFLVSEKSKTSMAIGYINELHLLNLNELRLNKTFSSNSYNPFLVVAKRWGNNFHTLLYTGPRFHQSFREQPTATQYEINSNFHYMISGTRNFVGIEINKEIAEDGLDMVIRPQMRLEISPQLMVGIVGGIPVHRENERLSSFIRLIYEPKHH